LRNVVGGMTLEDTLTSRDQINSQLRGVLDEATGRWGLRVARVELKAIDPPPSIQESMEKQMKADREKRAMILTAEGTRESQIKTAEGAKQAQILSAEGAKQSAILSAEGERQSRILRAQGERAASYLQAQGQAKAIEKVFAAIKTAEGAKQAQILSAEGAKQSAILSAEGERQSRILRAQGERAASYLQAQGQAKAIEKVFAAIKNGKPTPELLAYQYMQTLPMVARGDANKVWMVPSDFGKALEGFARNFGTKGDDGVFRYEPVAEEAAAPKIDDDADEVADWFDTSTDPAVARAVRDAESVARTPVDTAAP